MFVPSSKPNQQYRVAFCCGGNGISLALTPYSSGDKSVAIAGQPAVVLTPLINATSPSGSAATLAVAINAALSGTPTQSIQAAITAYVTSEKL